jgi:hypothetical protein
VLDERVIDDVDLACHGRRKYIGAAIGPICGAGKRG